MRFICTIVAVALVTGLLLVPRSAHAEPPCNSIYCEGKVTRLYLTASGTITYLRLQTDQDESGLNCTMPSNDQYLRLYSTSNTLFKEMYSALLTALAAGLKVRVRVVTGSNPCKIAYIMIMPK